ncbi:hypothetical protein I7I48_00241 [Histoplasma ohiense]|nr:hypothetical protein I7I48_00241 [Histoplasma ohiense (nom. inval.)]
MIPAKLQITLAMAALGLFGLTQAQKSIVTELSFPGPSSQRQLVASVVKVDPTATVFDLKCAPGADKTKCSIDGDISYTKMPPSLAMRYDGEGNDGPVRYSMECKIEAASADCTNLVLVSETGKGMVTKLSSSTHIPTAGYIVPLKVTITGGLEKLKGATATPAPTGGASVSPTGTNAPTTDSSSGLAMPLATHAANWGAIGGAAVAVAAFVL